MNGKTIRIHLGKGSPSDILTAEIINWTGKVIVAPRAMLADLAKREEVKRTGLYCLLGSDPENPIRDSVYIGEGHNVFKRLTAHDDDESKEFWTRCAVVIGEDQNITTSHGRYIESQLLKLAADADLATIHNGTAPQSHRFQSQISLTWSISFRRCSLFCHSSVLTSSKRNQLYRPLKVLRKQTLLPFSLTLQ